MIQRWNPFCVLFALLFVLYMPYDSHASDYQHSLQALSDVIEDVRWQLLDLTKIHPADPRYQRERIRIANYVRSTVRKQIVTCNQLREWGVIAPSNIHLCWSKLDEARAIYKSDHYGAALWAWQNGVGKCNEHASLVYYILKRSGAGDDLRILEKDSSHLFVAWGVVKGADPNDHASWGYNTLVIDSWINYIDYPWKLDSSYRKTDIFDATKRRDANARDGWMQFTSRLLIEPPLPNPKPKPSLRCSVPLGSLTKYHTNELQKMRNQINNAFYAGSIHDESERISCKKLLSRINDELHRRDLNNKWWRE